MAGRSLKTHSDHDMQKTHINLDNWDYKGETKFKFLSPVIFSAFMAASFGALSARRMLRKRSLISACFETESLQDEMHYDIAYTTIASEVDYGSFYAPVTCWTGDLEKFDV